MDARLIYAKTPAGDLVVNQRTQTIHRNLRLLLILIDGKMSVGELSAKVGNQRLVEDALRQLEKGGFIAPTLKMASADRSAPAKRERVSALAQFSVMSTNAMDAETVLDDSAHKELGGLSSFGKPILPVVEKHEAAANKSKNQRPLRRRTTPVRRFVTALGWVCALCLVLFLCILFYPYPRFKPEIEAEGTRLLQQQVQVGDVALSLLPTPVLTLSNLQLGGAGGATIEQVRIFAPFDLLFGRSRTGLNIEVAGAQFSVDQLAAFPLFSGRVKNESDGFVFKQIRIERSTASVPNLFSSAFSGVASFKENGALEHISAGSADRVFKIRVTPAAQWLQVDIEGANWQPFGRVVSFGSLRAKGLLVPGKLQIQELYSTFLGGFIKGNWLLNWGKQLSMTGDLSVGGLDGRHLSEAFIPSLKLEGSISGALQLQSTGASTWQGLWAESETTFKADVMRGAFHGAHLGDAVFRRGMGIPATGSTPFDRLKVDLTIFQGRIGGENLQLNAANLNVSGQFLFADERLSADLLVRPQGGASLAQTPVRLMGKLENLTMNIGH